MIHCALETNGKQRGQGSLERGGKNRCEEELLHSVVEDADLTIRRACINQVTDYQSD